MSTSASPSPFFLCRFLSCWQSRWHHCAPPTDPFSHSQSSDGGFKRRRAPVYRRGRHLPAGSEGKSHPHEWKSEAVQHKYLGRSTFLRRCWLWLIRWAPANNTRWNCLSQPLKKRENTKKPTVVLTTLTIWKCAAPALLVWYPCFIPAVDPEVKGSKADPNTPHWSHKSTVQWCLRSAGGEGEAAVEV